MAKVKLFSETGGAGGREGKKCGRALCPAETERRRPGRGKRKVYNRAAGIEILNYGITRLWNWRGAGGMRQRHGAENPGGDTVRKIWTAIRRGKSGRRYGGENPGGGAA